MRRTSAGGHSETPTELIARITAERGTAAAAPSGRHRRAAAAPEPPASPAEPSAPPVERRVIAHPAIAPPVVAHPAVEQPAIAHPAVEYPAVAHRAPDEPDDADWVSGGSGEDPAADDSETARIPTQFDPSTSAIPATPDVEPARPPVGHREIDREIDQDDAPRRRRHRSKTGAGRKLAPLAVGAAVMLVGATVATVIAPTSETTAVAAPDLDAALSEAARITSPTSAPGTTTVPTSAAAATTTEEQDEEQAEKTTTAPRSRSTTPRTTRPDPTTADRAPQAPGTSSAVAAPSGGGSSAADQQGWTRAGGDEFDGGLSSTWGVYEGAGHAGNGRRTRDAITVENGVLVIRGDGNGNTGGMAWGQNQRFGKWEMRARFPAGDRQYHPVLLLWPRGAWPQGGEVDFAETTSASSDVSFFLHYSASNQQKYAHKTIDITQWHNYAVEWTEGRITGYIDGVKWFESTDPKTLPPGEMHAAIQLDYFPSGGSPRPTEMHVDYMRIYR